MHDLQARLTSVNLKSVFSVPSYFPNLHATGFVRLSSALYDRKEE